MKLLFIQPYIAHYLTPLFRELGKDYELTILHSGRPVHDKNFKEIIISLISIGPFSFFNRNIYSLCKNYDIVISEANIRYLDRNLFILWPFRKFKWIAWGIGVSASYKNKFHDKKRLDRIRVWLFKNSEALIFYSSYPIGLYKNLGASADRLFVAHNTVDIVWQIDGNIQKKKIIFVGTLYKQKNIFSLLYAYKEYLGQSDSPLPLTIVGDGEELLRIENWISENALGKHIKLTGAVYDPVVLEAHFRESYACISPDQAGLSVLTSMGYGVPFITKRDAFTGGEIFNIEDKKNGLLYDIDVDLVSILNRIEKEPDIFIEMGHKALHHYLKNRTMRQMAHSMERAFDFAMTNSG